MSINNNITANQLYRILTISQMESLLKLADFYITTNTQPIKADLELANELHTALTDN